MKDYEKIVPMFYNFSLGCWNQNADLIYANLTEAVEHFLSLYPATERKVFLKELNDLSNDQEYINALQDKKKRFKYAWGGRALDLKDFEKIIKVVKRPSSRLRGQKIHSKF